ncbi:MAG: dual specificity protein phosphatase family protein [Desulfobacteraceae bacterium]|jgi:protein-tyrosine phosphatase
MSGYQLKWVTDNLAAGHAPVSRDQLEEIKKQGVSAIINLCGEYCDLHEIERDCGFLVYYLPVPDECAPVIEEMEKALLWMDEAIGRNEKVLVHCRFGIGRTGTVLMAFLMRSGVTMKAAEKMLKKTGAVPARYCQWKMLRKYHKKVDHPTEAARD